MCLDPASHGSIKKQLFLWSQLLCYERVCFFRKLKLATMMGTVLEPQKCFDLCCSRYHTAVVDPAFQVWTLMRVILTSVIIYFFCERLDCE